MNQHQAVVFLTQLGGPKTLNDIQPFLQNLFEDVFPLPKWLRKPLAKWVAKRRTPKVTPLYQAIGGGSPLLEHTQNQAQALQKLLATEGVQAHVHICMRYAPPRAQQAVEEARLKHGKAVWIELPLYPHYSFATTRSSHEELVSYLTHEEKKRLISVSSYETHPLYIDALAQTIQNTLQRFSSPNGVHLVFSAHGLPLKLVKEGDPYPTHIKNTLHALTQKFPHMPYTLAYQSKVGPVKWLEPSMEHALQTLAQQGVKKVLVVPISFVSEHIETLYELDVELKHVAHTHGITEYHRSEALGSSPLFIQALSNIVKTHVI